MPQFVPIEELFKGRHFDREIVILCVRWYLSFKLSYRDLVTMMGERGIAMAHTTILRWVQHYSPEFEKRWKRYARSVGGSWRMDETYVRVRGEWMYLYRAVDKIGKTVDFFLSRNRDVNAAKAFLRKAMRQQRTPVKITLDAYAASHRAVSDMKESGQLPKRVRVRASKYLNNVIEQDHRRVKQRLRPMLGLKSFKTAAVVIGGIELAEKIKKNQFKIGKLGGSRATVTEIWRWPLKGSSSDRTALGLSPSWVCTRTIYFTSSSSSPTGHLYTLGETDYDFVQTLSQVPITGNVMGAQSYSPYFLGDGYPGSPVTEFYNASTAQDYIFVSVEGAYQGCTEDSGCVFGFNVTSGSVRSAPTAATIEAGGTSGVIIDNASAYSGASQIYFTTLSSAGTCATSGGTGICAVQTSQSAP